MNRVINKNDSIANDTRSISEQPDKVDNSKLSAFVQNTGQQDTNPLSQSIRAMREGQGDLTEVNSLAR